MPPAKPNKQKSGTSFWAFALVMCPIFFAYKGDFSYSTLSPKHSLAIKSKV